MSKPGIGFSKLYSCPYCGNIKSTIIIYKDYEMHKCTKCKCKFKVFFERHVKS